MGVTGVQCVAGPALVLLTEESRVSVGPELGVSQQTELLNTFAGSRLLQGHDYLVLKGPIY